MLDRVLPATLCAVLLLWGCGSSDSEATVARTWQPEGPMTTVTFPDGSTIQAELRQTPEEQASGMMFRPELPPDNGMLFIFNRLEQMVTESFGLEAWDEIVVHSSLRTPNGVFVGPANYPDEDLFALVGTASRLTGKSVTELVRTFGRFLFRQLAMAYPVFIKPGMSARTNSLSRCVTTPSCGLVVVKA